ncbi:NAD kinase [Minicystis rosea]|nr:NAD kinase [Minicystis rosea]
MRMASSRTPPDRQKSAPDHAAEAGPRTPGRRPRIALVAKRSAYRLYVEEGHDVRLAELVAQNDPAATPLRASHEAHERTVREVQDAIATVGADLVAMRHAGESFDAADLDLVVTVGGDGTLLAASHFVGDVPVLAINSAPQHSVGFFCGAQAGSALGALRAAVRGDLRRAVLTRMSVTLNGRVLTERVLNDALYCHASPAATSRYILHIGDDEEQQKSSGFWIGPAAGSTAAQRSAGGRVLPLTSKQLQLVVREPYTPHGESYLLRHALIPPGRTLTVRSKMHDGRIFLDGPDKVLEIGYGDVVTFAQAPEPLTVLGISSRRKWG